MNNIDINLNEISPIDEIEIDNKKLQDVCVNFGEVIYIDKDNITDHDKLKNLDYEHSGHTGFASSEALSSVDERVKSLEEIGIPEDGLTPYIGENGNWFIGEEDTGVQAEGQDGKDGIDGVDGVGIATVSQGEVYESNGYTVTPITFTKTDDTFHTFGIKAKDGKSENLELYATKEYVEGLNEITNKEIESAKTTAQEYTDQKAEELNTEIAKKANQSDMETALSKKADITYVDNKISQDISSVQADLNNYKSTNDSAVKSNSDAIGILNGNSITEGSVDYKVNKAINEFAQAVTSNDTIDTFAEVLSYISTHGGEFSALEGEVDKNTKSVETLNGADNVVGSVDYKIKNAIANENLSQYATDSELKGVSDRVGVIESDYALDSDLGAVAKSNDYNDLDNKPVIPNEYTLPTATSDTLGGVKVGSNLSINNGVLSANSQTENSYTTTEKNKLAGIESGAQVNDVASVNGKVGAVTLSKGDVGLGNVDNVKQYSASNPPPYPVTSVNGQTGAVSISIPSISGLATESYVDTKVANLVNSAPETLDTLGELAEAIQDHEDEYDALLTTVGNKASKTDLDNYLPKSGGTITGNLTANNGITIPAGVGIRLNSKDKTQFMLYGDGQKTQSVYTQVIKSDGTPVWGKLIDIDTKLYSQNKEVATKEDFQDASIIFTSAPLEILGIDEYGIHINLPEIEIEKIDGSYNYCSGVGSIPIVAGNGISIATNASGKAEIKAPLVYSGYMLASHAILNNANNTGLGMGKIEAPVLGFNRTPQVGEGFSALVFDDAYGNIGSATFTITAKNASYAMCTMTGVVTDVFASKPNIVSLVAGTGTSASTVVLKLDFPAEAFIQRGRVQSSTALNPTLATVMQTIQFFLVSSGMTNTATTTPSTLAGTYIFYPASGFLKGSVVGEIVGVFSTGATSGTTLGVVFKTNTGTTLSKTIITITSAYISAINKSV